MDEIPNKRRLLSVFEILQFSFQFIKTNFRSLFLFVCLLMPFYFVVNLYLFQVRNMSLQLDSLQTLPRYFYLTGSFFSLIFIVIERVFSLTLIDIVHLSMQNEPYQLKESFLKAFKRTFFSLRVNLTLIILSSFFCMFFLCVYALYDAIWILYVFGALFVLLIIFIMMFQFFVEALVMMDDHRNVMTCVKKSIHISFQYLKSNLIFFFVSNLLKLICFFMFPMLAFIFNFYFMFVESIKQVNTVGYDQQLQSAENTN